MTSNKTEPSAWQLLAPITDLVTPMAVRVAATLRLADLMAGGVEQVEELARRTGTDPEALGRLLRHLTRHGVFTEPTPGGSPSTKSPGSCGRTTHRGCGRCSTWMSSAAGWTWCSPG
jgi:hypothetical protein